MENFNWRMIVESISMLTKALPKDEKMRRWVVIGTVVVVAAAAFGAAKSQGDNRPAGE